MPAKEKVDIEIEVPSKEIHVEHVYCPNGHSLIDVKKKIHGHPAIKVSVKYKGQEGMLYLDPVYGSYDNVFEGIKVPKKEVVEIFCPECKVSLTEEGEKCHLCSAPLFIFNLPQGGIVEGCLRHGCVYHKMKIVGAEEQVSRLFENDTLESYL